MPNEDMKDFEGFRDVADDLPAALATASPHRLPPRVRSRVLREVEARTGRARALPDIGWLKAGGVAVLLGLVVALGVWNVRLQQGLADERTLVQQLRDSAKESVIFEVVDSAGSQKISLRAVGPQRPGEDPPYGKVYTNPAHAEVVVMGGRLPAPDANEEYHLYLLDRTGTTLHAGVLRVDATGFGYLIYQTGTRGPAFSAARVYLQPRGTTSPGGALVLQYTAQ
jgi:hypothetical protein